MGFKCPICMKDFKFDKKKWKKHISEDHDGDGESIVKFVVRTAEGGKVMKGKRRNHEGLRTDRNKFNYAERVFTDLWKKENERVMGFNGGKGALDCILTRKPTQIDAEVAGTVIQWLGTGIGKAFLNEAEKRIELIREIDGLLHHLINNLDVGAYHHWVKMLEYKKELIFVGQSTFKEDFMSFEKYKRNI